MERDIQGVFTTRVQHNMAIAVSTQNINIIAFNFDKGPNVLTPDKIISGLKLLPRLCPNRTILDEFRDIFVLFKSINTVKPDVVHVDALQDLFSVFVAVRLCAINGHKPTIIAMSRNSLSWKNPKKAWLYAKLIKHFSDGFVALATTHKNQLLQLGVPSNKLTVIPNPYDPACVRTNGTSHNKKPHKTPTILYVANICENKAQDVLIHAAAAVIKRVPDVKFELVGKILHGQEEYAEQLHSLIKQYNIEQSIRFVGQVPYEDVLASLEKSDIFVFPTLTEMMPRAVIEAMVIGKPVIASAVDGILDIIQNKETGLLVQPGNIAELADAICELLENPELANTIGLAGQRFVLEFCSPEKVGRQFCDFYKYTRATK